jgi:hypothetical protein
MKSCNWHVDATPLKGAWRRIALAATMARRPLASGKAPRFLRHHFNPLTRADVARDHLAVVSIMRMRSARVRPSKRSQM